MEVLRQGVELLGQGHVEAGRVQLNNQSLLALVGSATLFATMPAAHAFSLQASARARLFLSRCAQQRRSFKLRRDSAKRQVLRRTSLRFLPWQPGAGAANRHAQNHWVFCRAHSLCTGQGLGDAQCGPERAANCGCRAVFVTSGGLRLCAKYRLHPFVVELCRVWLGAIADPTQQ